MSSDIAPGDWVKCVDGKEVDSGPTVDDDSLFSLGAVYLVDGCIEWRGRPGLHLANMPRSRHPTGAWNASCFRKLNRITDAFRRDLMAPVDLEPATVGQCASPAHPTDPALSPGITS